MTSVCYGRGWSDLWAISSLLNLTADLRASKQKSVVILKGIAADLNFEGYQLEYADVKSPNVWNLVAPASDVPVINDVFTTWVPPYEGTFYVRLTVWDKAGNKAFDRKRVSWGLFSSITNLYKNLDLFSPNGDGVRDTFELHYRVLEPAHLEFYIYDKDNNLITTFIRDYTSPIDDFIAWDGRDSSGRIAPDGKYKIKVFDYEFFVEVDNTPPDVNLLISSINQHPEYLYLYVNLVGHAFDGNLKDWFIEFGEGDNPREWFEFMKGNDLIVKRDEFGNPILNPVEDITIKNLGREAIEWLVGKKLRITAEDFAGNRSATITNPLEERIILYIWQYKGNDYSVRLTKNQKGDFLPAIISADLAQRGQHFPQGDETIRSPIVKINVQYTDKYDSIKGEWTDWKDSQPLDNPKSGMIRLDWDNSNLDLSDVYAVRIKAVDILGQEHYSNILYSGEKFNLNAECPTLSTPPITLTAINSIFKKLNLLRFQAISLQDPDYKTWTDIEICYTYPVGYNRLETKCVKSLPVSPEIGMPEGKFSVYAPTSQFKPEMSYIFRMVGIPEGVGNYIISNQTIYPPGCEGISLDVNYQKQPNAQISVSEMLTGILPWVQASFAYDSSEENCGFISGKTIISTGITNAPKTSKRDFFNLLYPEHNWRF